MIKKIYLYLTDSFGLCLLFIVITSFIISVNIIGLLPIDEIRKDPKGMIAFTLAVFCPLTWFIGWIEVSIFYIIDDYLRSKWFPKEDWERERDFIHTDKPYHPK